MIHPSSAVFASTRPLIAALTAVICVSVQGWSQARFAEEPGPHARFREMYPEETPVSRVQGGTNDPGIRPLTGDRRAALVKEVFGYFPYWFRGRWNLVDYSLLSTVAYFSGEAAADGSIGDTHGWPRSSGDPSASADVLSLINAAHSQGVRVVLCITCFTAADLQTLLSSQANRTRLIQQALGLVRAGNGDGVNIDFEAIPSASRDDLTAFMRALADTFHTRLPGSQVSAAPTDFDTRAGDWDLTALHTSLDLFFFQGYGYGYKGSTVTTPVGLLTNTAFWGHTNITTLIDFVTSRIGPTKVLLGLPHFGYRWPATSPDPKASTQGTGVAFYYPDALVAVASYGRQWDQLALNPWYRYQSGAQWYQGWYDDPESMDKKYRFAFDRDLEGVGMWALGMDNGNHDIWDVLAKYVRPSSAVTVTASVPTEVRLEQNFPNPFNPRTSIEFWIPDARPVRLAVYDILGREITTLVDRSTPAGTHMVPFDASTLPSGVYYYRLTTGNTVLTRSALFVR